MRGEDCLAAIRADGDLLVPETMFFPDEVCDRRQSLGGLSGAVHLRRQRSLWPPS